MEKKQLKNKKFLFISPFYKSRNKNGGYKRCKQLIEKFSEYDFLFLNPYYNLKQSFIFLKKDNNYFRSNFYKYRNEIEVYKYSEKVITISEYDYSILACHNINSKCLPYFPAKKNLKKLVEIGKYRKKNLKKITNNGYILILGSIINNPTKLGIIKLINLFNQVTKLGCSIKLAGYGTEELIEIEKNKIDILGSVSENVLEELMKNCKCLIINQSHTSGFLTKIVDFNLARIPILITSNYYQAKNLENYGIFFKEVKLINNILLNRLLNENYKLFKPLNCKKDLLKYIYN